MKKTLFVLFLLILLIASFRVGTWYSQRWTGGDDGSKGERRILHYVDPMNPTNVSIKPGIAPCGMPMEPVYDDREPAGMGAMGQKRPMALGAVKISQQKQQLIGVQVGSVEETEETHLVRTLGRIAADENRIFPINSAVDGWMSYIPGSTTGSLVEKGQLMALIKVYDYDFFQWQQRYLSELASLTRRYLPATNFTGARQPWRHSSRPSRTAAPKSGSGSSMKMSPTQKPPAASTKQKRKSALQMPFSAMKPKFKTPAMMPGAQSQPETSPSDNTTSVKTPPSAMEDMTDFSMAMSPEVERRQGNLDPTDMGEDDILYANKGRLELMNRGVTEAQLRKLAKEGKYIPNIQIRSPVTGLVIDRPISPLEKVDRGTECFRIADLSRVWILADVFNIDAKYIQPGMRAQVSFPRQNKPIEAVVSDIFPPFDAKTRTLKVRLEMKNPEYVFRPDMFVDVDFLIPLPPAITVPASAVLDSGRRKVVFISHKGGYFEPRQVVTGWRFGDRVEIVKGLAAGEQIVVSGNFLIDSESRMKVATVGLMAKPEPEKGPSDAEKPSTPSHAEPGHD